MSDPRWIGARCELLERLGGGADAAAWRGRDQNTGSECFIRFLTLGKPGPSGLTAAARRWQLLGTVDAVARLAHPGLVAVDEAIALDDTVLLDDVVPGGGIAAGKDRWVLISRIVPGENLADRLARTGTLPARHAPRLLAQLCDALAAAHAVGLVHGRVKPSNLLLEPGTGDAVDVRLADFGLAALESWAANQAPPDPAVAAARARYRPPEWIPGLPATAAGDIYAVGAMLYEVLVGRPPFDGADPEQTARLQRESQPLWVPEIPDELWVLVTQCLAKRPSLRPAAADLAVLLRRSEPGSRLPIPHAGAATRGVVQLRHAGDAPLPARHAHRRHISTARRVEVAASATAVALAGGLTFTFGGGFGALQTRVLPAIGAAAQPASSAPAQRGPSGSSPTSGALGLAGPTTTSTAAAGWPGSSATGAGSPPASASATVPISVPSSAPSSPASGTTAPPPSGGLPVSDPIGYLEQLRGMIQQLAAQGSGTIDANAAGDLENLVLDLENAVDSYEQNGGQGLLQMIKSKIADFDARLSDDQSRGLISASAAGELAAYLQKLSPA